MKKSSARDSWILFLILFVFLLIVRFPVLTMPLYEDQAVGFGREADFLDQTDFDYRRLRYEETHFLFGGTARSYLISVIPTTLALLHRILGSSSAMLIAWHLLSLALASATAAILYSLLKPFAGRLVALLGAMALLSTPMVLTQADLAGMELPLVVCMLLAGHAILNNRPMGAIAWATASFFMKATGLLVLGSVLAILLGRVMMGERDQRRKDLFCLVVGSFTFAGLVALLSWADDTTFFRATYHWPSGFRLPRALLVCPDLAILTGLTSVIGLFLLFYYRKQIRLIIPQWRARDSRLTLMVWALLIVGGSILSMASYIFIPRYYIMPQVAVYVLLGLALSLDPRLLRMGIALLGGVIVVNLVNHAGRLYPPIANVAGPDFKTLTVFTLRSCGFTERSLEYLDDHRSSITAVRTLSERGPKATIFADMPHWIYLTCPFVGYVSAPPVDVVRADNYQRTICEFRDRVMETPMDHEILFLWTEKASPRMPRISDGVDVVYKDSLDPPLAVLRVRRDELPRTPKEIENWFLDQSWDIDHVLHRALDRYEFLRRTGQFRRAERELQFAIWMHPNPRDSAVNKVMPALLADIETAKAHSQDWQGDVWELRLRPETTAVFAKDSAGKGLLVTTGTVADEALRGVRLLGPRKWIQKGDTVRIRGRVRASRDTDITIGVERLFDPQVPFIEQSNVEVGTNWKDFDFTWPAPSPEHDAVLYFDIGRSNARFELSDVRFEVTHQEETNPQ